jgi:hypothetical protein
MVTFSAGFTDVLADLLNDGASAKVIVTGGSTGTFFESVTNSNDSEFRVTTGATAVFLGSVTGLSQFTGGGTKIFEGPAAVGSLETTGATIVEAGGDLAAQRIREKSLAIHGRASIVPNGTVAATSNVKSLMIDGGATPTGTLDLADNALVVDYTFGEPSPLALIRAQIAYAFNGGSWDRTGLTSSLADMGEFGLGYAEAATLGGVPAIFGVVDSDAALVRLARYGDANLDGSVNLNDFNRLAASFGSAGSWFDGDVNYDGAVNLLDFNRLAANFGLVASPGGPTPQDWAILASLVPEPGVAGSAMFLLMVAGALRRLG